MACASALARLSQKLREIAYRQGGEAAMATIQIIASYGMDHCFKITKDASFYVSKTKQPPAFPRVHRIPAAKLQGLTEVKQQLQGDLLIRSMQNKVVMGGEWTHQRDLGKEYMDLSRCLLARNLQEKGERG